MSASEPLDPALAFLAAGGELGERLRAFDWSSNPLGPPASWPQSLKTAVRIMLTSRQPIWIGWGPALIYLYNDPYTAIVGGKHPDALGRPVLEVWREIEDVISPMLTTAMSGDTGTYVESQLLIMERHGYREETYYTFSYSPIPDDDGSVGGIICANTDDTGRVIGERQLALLRELATRTADARTWQEACAHGIEALADDPHDLPFAMLYLADPDSTSCSLLATVGIERGHPAAPVSVPLIGPSPWPMGEVLRDRALVVVGDLERFDAPLPTGAWPEAPTQAAVLPLGPAGLGGRTGALVVGLSPFRALDDAYRRFLSLVVGQLVASIASAQAYEQERRRAESLAEIDRAKTVFFSNVSHELRTPLTLMLGPVEDLLDDDRAALSPSARAQLEVVLRNGIRLLKLVNTMLDFSRIEAGRMQASFEPVRLEVLTAELASVFRAAIERAGLRLVVQCPPLPTPVHVDRDMWEKIVLNLISNALKFTLEGEIRVTVDAAEDQARLVVSDTGVGIPQQELERVFDRFHRVAQARGRTHEGSGIGLSLVRELVRLHGGSVHVRSTPGEGATFVVTVPLGRAHLDPRQVRASAASDPTPRGDRAVAFVQEALHWLPEPSPAPDDEHAWARQALATMPETKGASDRGGDRPRVLLADDNADMREYVRRLLVERFAVEAVPDGQAALEAIRRDPPGLVLSDVMMPRLDGFGLLAAIRADERLRSLPVILLSARAGEEARVDGLEAGADDYLIKPFTARELLARVSAHLQMASMRHEVSARLREQEERLRLALETGRLGAWEFELSAWTLECSARAKADFGLGPQDTLDYERLGELIHPEDRAGLRQAIEHAVEAHASFGEEIRAVWPRDGSVHWVVIRGRAVYGPEGRPTHLTGVTQDVTERRQAEEALRESERWFRMVADTAPAMLWLSGPDKSCTFLSRGWYEFTGQTEAEALGLGWIEAIHPDDRDRARQAFADASTEQVPFELDYRLRRADGEYRWAIASARPRVSADGEFLGYTGSVIDVHERKQAEEGLRQADRRKDEFLATLAHELRNPLAPIRTGLELLESAGDDPAMLARVRGTMERQLSHVVRLIDDLLDVSRISRGKIQLRPERVTLSTIVEQALEIASPNLERSGHTVSISLPPEPVHVRGDPTRLLQIVGNLLHNADKYTPRGGSVRISVAVEGDQAVVRVADTGVGLAADQLEQVFEMFMQVSPSGRRSPGGSDGGLGIGLTLVRSLATLHGGIVTAASEGPGRGSEFTVRLPLDPEPEPAEGQPPEAGASAEAVTRVLVVDDNRDAAEMMGLLLTHAGHAVEMAFDGEQALELAERFEPDVILLDIGLPGIDGYEVCRRIRARPWGRDAKLVALTGWGQKDDRARSRDAGFDVHLVKPIDHATLTQVLQRG